MGDLTTASLPRIEAVQSALQADPWSTTNYCLLPLAFLISFGRRLACLMEDNPHGVDTVEGVAELNEIWAALNEICDWTVVASRLEASDPFSITILQLYLNLCAGGAIFAQLAVVEHQEQLKTSPIFSSVPPQPLSTTLTEFAMNVCSYLRSVRTDGQKSFMAVFTGTAWSVSRLAAFANVFNGTSAWNKSLHPAGPADKIVSLRFLCSTLNSVLRSYDSEPLRKALMALEAEKGALEILLGPTNIASVPLATSNQPLTDQPVSLGRLAAWKHILDKEAKQSLVFEEAAAASGLSQPFFRRAGFSAFAASNAATPPFSYTIEAVKNQVASPAVSTQAANLARTSSDLPAFLTSADPPNFDDPLLDPPASTPDHSSDLTSLINPPSIASLPNPAFPSTLSSASLLASIPQYNDEFFASLLFNLDYNAPTTNGGQLDRSDGELELELLSSSGGFGADREKLDFLSVEQGGGVDGGAGPVDTIPYLWQ
ncbi:hypothetical protein JCM8547_008061 [Rhodosporidiobolus lusitaniae]